MTLWAGTWFLIGSSDVVVVFSGPVGYSNIVGEHTIGLDTMSLWEETVIVAIVSSRSQGSVQRTLHLNGFLKCRYVDAFCKEN